MQVLNWTDVRVDQTQPSGLTKNSLLGTPNDGVRFLLQYRGACYRRGRWLLLIDVIGGKYHHHWGCFDHADQPIRNYHKLENAISEAEEIAKVLLCDRLNKGEIEELLNHIGKNT